MTSKTNPIDYRSESSNKWDINNKLLFSGIHLDILFDLNENQQKLTHSSVMFI